MRALSSFAVFGLLLQALVAFAAPSGHGPLADLSHVRRIAIRLVAGPARGNTGAAIIAAEQIRRAGFGGELFLGVPAPAAAGVLHEMLPGYELGRERAQSVSLATGGVVTVIPAPDRDSWGGPASRPDLELRFGDLDHNAQAGRGTRLLIATGIFSDLNPMTRISIGNALLRSWGETFSFSGLVGFRGLGLYGDPVAEGAALAAAREGGRGELFRESAGILREEGRRLGRSERLDLLAEWLESPGAEGRSFALTYGFGYNDIGTTYFGFNHGLDHLRSYLSAVRAAAGTVGRTVLVAQVLPPKAIAALQSHGFAVVNLPAGEPPGAEPGPGEVKVILCGGMPRQVYGRLLAVSDLPPVVEGNSSTSAAHALGRPYLVTSSRHNGAMRSQMSKDLSALDAEVGGQFEAFSKGEGFSLQPFLSPAGHAAFRRLSQRLREPVAVTFVRLAERLLSEPMESRVLLRRWREEAVSDALVDGSSAAGRLCAAYLAAPAPGPGPWYGPLLAPFVVR